MRRAALAPRPRAFTLLEMVVVLAVVVLTAAVAWPALRRSLDDAQLVDSAKLVRTTLARARLAAMESGRGRWFRYQPLGRKFEVADSPPRDQRDAQEDSPLVRSEAERGELPEGVWFAAPDDEPPLAAGPAGSAEAVSPQPRREASEIAQAETTWSEPIEFRPDGRARDARIALTSGSRRVATAWLRGLTGTATIDQHRSESTAASSPEANR